MLVDVRPSCDQCNRRSQSVLVHRTLLDFCGLCRYNYRLLFEIINAAHATRACVSEELLGLGLGQSW